MSQVLPVPCRFCKVGRVCFQTRREEYQYTCGYCGFASPAGDTLLILRGIYNYDFAAIEAEACRIWNLLNTEPLDNAAPPDPPQRQHRR